MISWMLNVIEFLFLLLVAATAITMIVGFVYTIIIIVKETISDFISRKRK